ncbi:WD40 repeat-like protein, partial [Exidia glandulosa HHB12029]
MFPRTNTLTQPQADIEVADPPTDSISALAFCPTADFLAAASWNGEVRIYEVAPDGQTKGKAMYAHDGTAPALSVTYSKDGSKVFSGGADNVVRAYDLTSGQSAVVAKHDGAVKAVKFFESPSAGAILVTGSWDQTLKYWDLRSPNPIASVQLAGKCYALDVVFPLMVVGSSERKLQVFNLNQPGQPVETLESPLKWQTRTISCFPSADGYAVGSVEGRVAIQWADPKRKGNNYSFRCHRKEENKANTLVYAVNDVQWHPVHGTFLTAGSDGTISMWDKDARARLKNFPAAPGPIATTAFSRNGNILAYAVSYDWS